MGYSAASKENMLRNVKWRYCIHMEYNIPTFEKYGEIRYLKNVVGSISIFIKL
jgi:hypothetical protein